MTPGVTAAVLLAAVAHAGWNALAHRITDKPAGFTPISGGGLLIGPALMPFAAPRRPGRGRTCSPRPPSTSPPAPC